MKIASGLLSSLFILSIGSLSFSASAAIVISSTRIIYPAADREVTVQISNQGSGPVLLQSWLDDGRPDALPDTLKVPFVLTPPVNRLDAGKSQSVRIRYTGSGLPSDRESMLWFNALEIPPKASKAGVQNLLQMAFRTRIKLFFRPSSLAGTPDEAARQLRWESRGNTLTATNNTPWHVSLTEVETTVNGKKLRSEADTVPPFASRSFPVPQGAAGKVTAWFSVNDYGAIRAYPDK